MFTELRQLPVDTKKEILKYLVGVKLEDPVGNDDYQQGLYDGFKIALELVKKCAQFMLFGEN